MEEQLQGLLDRIRKDGVEKAESEAEDIVAKARAEAARIIDEARREAAEHTARAERDAEVFEERSITTLEQVGRDFLLRLRTAIENVLRESARQSLGEALTPEAMANMLERMASAYADKDFNEHRVDVLLSEKDQEAFVDTVFDRYRDLLGEGLDVHVDDRIHKGFKVRFLDYRLYHDFTLEAIAEVFARLLKSPLDEIMRRAADDEAGGDRKTGESAVDGERPPASDGGV